MSDLPELIAAWQASLPGSAWQADSDPPDAAALGEWMAQKMSDAGGLKVRSADPLYDRVVRYLEFEGVDVRHALRRAEDARDAAASRTRADVHTIRDLALTAKRADKRLEFEQSGLRDGCAGFSAAQVHAAAGEVAEAEFALLEACGHDRGLARQARRAVS